MNMFYPKDDDLAAILPHIRYEIQQCFVVPTHDTTDSHIRESTFLAMLIHARLLLDFFETKKREHDDVLCSDFDFLTAPVPIEPDDRKRLNKDIAHLTYSRLRHTPATKLWPVESILGSLRPTVVAFIRHVIDHPPKRVQIEELQHWSALYRAFTQCS